MAQRIAFGVALVCFVGLATNIMDALAVGIPIALVAAYAMRFKDDARSSESGSPSHLGLAHGETRPRASFGITPDHVGGDFRWR